MKSAFLCSLGIYVKPFPILCVRVMCSHLENEAAAMLEESLLKMASSFTKNNDAFINKSKIMLSTYAEGLELKVKQDIWRFHFIWFLKRNLIPSAFLPLKPLISFHT